MWVVEPSSDANLAEESIWTERGSEIRMQHLECDDPLVFGILREINRRHTSATELPIHRVGRREDVADTLDWGRHAVFWRESKPFTDPSPTIADKQLY
jgi:hypothetical protein